MYTSIERILPQSKRIHDRHAKFKIFPATNEWKINEILLCRRARHSPALNWIEDSWVSATTVHSSYDIHSCNAIWLTFRCGFPFIGNSANRWQILSNMTMWLRNIVDYTKCWCNIFELAKIEWGCSTLNATTLNWTTDSYMQLLFAPFWHRCSLQMQSTLIDFIVQALACVSSPVAQPIPRCTTLYLHSYTSLSNGVSSLRA